MKCHPGMKFVLGWNHPCLWRNVSYCLHGFGEMKFHPGIKKRKKRNLTKFTRCRPQAFKRSHFMHLAFNRLMFLTYQASDFNNWEKRKILLYAFIILDGRFSFKLNFIPGRNSHVNRNFFLPRGYFISVTCKRTRSVSDIFYIKMAMYPVNMGAISHIAVLHRS